MGGVFLDKDEAPDEAALEQALGPARVAWNRLVGRATGALGARAGWSWTGRRSGWELRCTRAGRPFVTLSPGRAGFDALVVLGRAEVAVAAGLDLRPELRERLAATPALHDGTWLFLRVDSVPAAQDVLDLLLAKLPPTVRARLPAEAAGA